MKANRIYTLIQNPKEATPSERGEILNLVRQYPYFQQARMLHVKLCKISEDASYKDQLERAAIYVTNRSYLNAYVQQDMNFAPLLSTTSSIGTSHDKPALPSSSEVIIPSSPVLTPELPNTEKEVETDSVDETLNDITPETISDPKEVADFSLSTPMEHDSPDHTSIVNYDSVEEASLLASPIEEETSSSSEESPYMDSLSTKEFSFFTTENEYEFPLVEPAFEDDYELDLNESISPEPLAVEEENHDSDLSLMDDTFYMKDISPLEESEPTDNYPEILKEPLLLAHELPIIDNFNDDDTLTDSSTTEEENLELNDFSFETDTQALFYTPSSTPPKQNFEEIDPDHLEELETKVAAIDNSFSFDEWLSRTSLSDTTPEKVDKGPNHQSIIDQFLANNPKINFKRNDRHSLPEHETDKAAHSIEEDQSLITETLALLFEKQGKNEKAIDAYQRLILKYPEKSSFFAQQIEKIRKTS